MEKPGKWPAEPTFPSPDRPGRLSRRTTSRISSGRVSSRPSATASPSPRSSPAFPPPAWGTSTGPSPSFPSFFFLFLAVRRGGGFSVRVPRTLPNNIRLYGSLRKPCGRIPSACRKPRRGVAACAESGARAHSVAYAVISCFKAPSGRFSAFGDEKVPSLSENALKTRLKWKIRFSPVFP